MKLLIVVRHHFELWNAPAWLAGRLRHDFPGLEVVQLPNYEGIDEQLADTEILLAWSLRPEQVKAAKKLRWIHSPVAAVHLLMIPEIIESDIVVTNAREINGPVVAEHVIAQIFALAKCLPTAVRMQQQRAWGQDEIWRQRPKEIAGATLGLVGVGSIGSEVAKRAAALGMRVFAVRENSAKPKPQGVERVFDLGQIDEMLALADYVVLAAPVTLLNDPTHERRAHREDEARELFDQCRARAVDRRRSAGRGFTRGPHPGRCTRCLCEGAFAREFAVLASGECAGHAAHRGDQRTFLGAAIRVAAGESAPLPRGRVAAGGCGQEQGLLRGRCTSRASRCRRLRADSSLRSE